MAEQRRFFTPPEQSSAPPNNIEPDTILQRLMEGLMGNQLPGDLPSAIGAGALMLPISKLLRGLKLRQAPKMTPSPSAIGDNMLREHVVGSPRLREFLPVGEEGAAMKADPWQTILDLHGKPKPSPGGAPKPPKVATEWPKTEDLDALKTRLRKPKNGV